jgi:Viral BACON domain
MSQCLRCSKLCEATAVFCGECRSLLRNQLQQGLSSHALHQVSSSLAISLVDSPTLPEYRSVQDEPLERITGPLPSSRANQVPQPPELAVHADPVEQAVSKLSEAAQRIEQEEELSKSDRKARHYSRVSRLAPIRDISADIRRESTPLPQISSTQQSEPTSKNGLKHQLSNGKSPADMEPAPNMPDLWPWLDTDSEDKDSDIWANRTDPFISRRIPTSAESARIEEEDIRRAMAEGISTSQFPISRTVRHSSRMRIAFIALAIFALIALLVDGILLSIALSHPRRGNIAPGGPPTLTLSQNAAANGDTVQLFIAHFTPSTQVALTHDIQEPIQVNGGSSLIIVGSTGSAKASLVIDSNWKQGFHLIVAEDVTTRYTASAMLQITGSGPTRPAHLNVSIDTSRPLDLGAAVVGANSIYSLKLQNSGGGSISWSASSDQPWLLVSPGQGIFSESQTISIAGQRVGLKPGDYKGFLTITSNVSPPVKIEVDMTVLRLPPNAGPVLALSPALFSFTATDGGPNPPAQSLTISNPGSHTLYWSLASTDPATVTTQVSLLHALGSKGDWLSTDVTSGTVAPGATSSIQVIVQSQNLLPGAYIGTLVFTAPGGIDSPQSVNVSLTVQPHCGIVTSLGYMAFTAVAGQSNQGNQTLSLNATVSCAGVTIPWSSSSSVSWLTVTPASGQVKGTASAVVSVVVNAASLAPGKYYGIVSFISSQSSQTVMVQLTVQAPPSPTAPIMGASPLTLNFSNTQGQPSPTGQVVTITNNGRSPLTWRTGVACLLSCWLGSAPSGGTIAAGQTGQVTIKVDTSQLTPGNYVGQVTLNGSDSRGATAPGSPQIITINLVVQPPCIISPPSSSALSFSAVQGGPSPAAQTIAFTGTGSCAWPVTWHISPSASWLKLAPVAGTINGTGQSGSIGVAVSTGLPVGTYATQVTISATDNSGAVAQGSPQTFSVTLTILPPCVVSPPASANLSFSVAQGQPAPLMENVTLSETGTCARPVSWTATSDTTWLVLSPASGTDSGSGSNLGVNVNAANLAPGPYSGTITITATDGTGAAVSGLTLRVSLTVAGFTISGPVVGCSDQICTTSTPLPGATVKLMNGSTTIATVIADASGNYAFSNIALGTYTISVDGTDASNTHYVGSATLTVSGDTPNFTIQAFPG